MTRSLLRSRKEFGGALFLSMPYTARKHNSGVIIRVSEREPQNVRADEVLKLGIMQLLFTGTQSERIPNAKRAFPLIA